VYPPRDLLKPSNSSPRPLARQPAGGQAAVRPATTRGGDVRLGLSVGYWGFGITPDEQLAMAVEAERLGFHWVWAAVA
jgi:hypothetical protein